jgi:hypothetical protein
VEVKIEELMKYDVLTACFSHPLSMPRCTRHPDLGTHLFVKKQLCNSAYTKVKRKGQVFPVLYLSTTPRRHIRGVEVYLHAFFDLRTRWK